MDWALVPLPTSLTGGSAKSFWGTSSKKTFCWWLKEVLSPCSSHSASTRLSLSHCWGFCFVFGLLLPLRNTHKTKRGEVLFLRLNFSCSSLCKIFHESSQPFPTAPLLESSRSCYGSRYGPCPEEERELKQPDHPGICKPGVTDTFLCSPRWSGKFPQTEFVKHTLYPDFSPLPRLTFTLKSWARLSISPSKKRYPRTSLKASRHVARARCNLQAASNLAGEPGLTANPGWHRHTRHGCNRARDITKLTAAASSPPPPFCSLPCLQSAENAAHTL